MKQNLINVFLEKGYLLSPDFFSSLNSDFDVESFLVAFEPKIESKETPIVLTKDLGNILMKLKQPITLNWYEFEKSRALLEKGRNDQVYQTFLEILNYNLSDKNKIASLLEDISEPPEPEVEKEIEGGGNVIVLKSYGPTSNKRDVGDFISYFRTRYNNVKELLQKRPELQNSISISRVFNKELKDPVSIIGMISDKHVTKNGHLLLKVEDLTGSITVLLNKDSDIFRLSNELVLDEIVGIDGQVGNGIIFSNSIYFPDIPMTKEIKRSSDEAYAVFISDLHVGSNVFLEKDFNRFLNWINGQTGSIKQRRIASKTKYLFIAGDVIDGVGVYPDQDKDLAIKEISLQYKRCAELLSSIRKDIKIIICPGNHDALRIAEPQPIFDATLAKSLYELDNVVIVSNPAMVNIHSSKEFSGFDVLMYHGYSFDHYASNVEAIRLNGGYDRGDLIMKYLLQRRHLAPVHGSTLYVPTPNVDPLFIDKVPDFLITGHIHKLSINTYNNVVTICGSCWQPKTDFQERVGHNPEPSKVATVNLKTREINVLNFGS